MPIKNSILVVNFNNAEALRRMLTNLKLDESIASEVIVVDSASPDDSAAMVKSQFPQMKLIERELNRGFAAAANAGIAQAVGDVVVLCHSDLVTNIHALVELADRVREGASRRVVGALPRLIDAAKEEQPFVGRLPALGRAMVGVFHPPLARRAYVPALDHVADHEWASFACIALSSDFIASAGGALDERFFLYYAEADLCQRIHDRSYRLLIAPDVKVAHTGRSPNDELPPHLQRIMRKDQQRYFEKHRPKWQQGVLRLDIKLYSWLRKDPAAADAGG